MNVARKPVVEPFGLAKGFAKTRVPCRPCLSVAAGEVHGSGEERRRLEKPEQELAATDPDLDRQLQDGLSRNWASARTIYSVLAFFAGFALVFAGITTQLAVIGVGGFLLMVAAAIWFRGGLRAGNVTGRQPERRADGDPGPRGRRLIRGARFPSRTHLKRESNR